MLRINTSVITSEYFYLNVFGSTWVLEMIYLAIILPLAIIGFFLNILSIIIIIKIKKNNSNIIYNYFAIYCVNSTLMMILIGPSFYYFTPRIIGLRLDLFAKIFNSYMANFFAPTLSLFGHLFDILICYDRLTIFKPYLKSSQKPLFSYMISIIIYVFCLAINVLSFLRIRMVSDEEVETNLMRSINKTIIFYINGRGIFSNNLFVTGSLLFFRDILTLFLEISISILLLIKVREYIKTAITSATSQSYIYNQHVQVASSSNNTTSNNSRKKRKVTINFTKLTLYLSLISIISHTVYIATFTGFFFVSNPIIVNYLITLAFLCLSTKHALNFFVLVFFDKNFKTIFRYMIK